MRGIDATCSRARLLVSAAVCLGVLLSAGAARAGWTRPAGGPSASGDPEVLFTFDDGPHETHTAAILDELARRKVKAIFFWVGWRLEKGKRAAERVELVRRAVREGHLVANHTMTHVNLCQVKAAQAASEIDDNIKVLEQASGMPVRLFRAPYGVYCKRLEAMLAERALAHMHWDIDPQEWDHHDVDRTARFIIRRLEALEGRAIVILHDTHLVTVKALPRVLDWIEAENARRRDGGARRPIRIISGSELVSERPDLGVLRWARDTTLTSASHLEALIVRLIP